MLIFHEEIGFSILIFGKKNLWKLGKKSADQFDDSISFDKMAAFFRK